MALDEGSYGDLAKPIHQIPNDMLDGRKMAVWDRYWRRKYGRE